MHGEAATGVNESWAVYSNGEQFSTTNGNWTTSDAQLKTNIEDLEGSLEKVLALSPKTYQYVHDAAPQLNLSHGDQVGFLAQDLELVLPDMVRSITIPAELDSLGNIVPPAIESKAVNYTMIIPVLVGAIKEQQERLEAQQTQIEAQQELLAQNSDLFNQDLLSRIEQMEQLLELCCQASSPGDGGQRMFQDDGLLDMQFERLLAIQPNPFTDHTSVSYTLERGGRVMLLVNSSDGKHLLVLQEATQSDGEYRYEWTTSGLASGIYYVTLLLDGEPLVKRAGKVAR